MNDWSKSLEVGDVKPIRRKDGTWCLQVRLSPGPKGRKMVYAGTPELCWQKAKDLLKQQKSLQSLPDVQVFPAASFGEFYETVFKPTMMPKWKSSQTRKKNASMAKIHLLPTFGNAPLVKVTHDHIVVYRDSLLDLSAKQQSHILSHLKGVFKLAHKLSRVTTDPTAAVPLPDVPKRKEREEPPIGYVQELESIVEGTYLEGVIWLIHRTCMRRGEVAGLRVSDIKKDHIHICNQRHGDLSEGPPKGGKSRDLYMPAHLLERLRSYASSDRIYVFADERGRPLKPNEITKAIKKLHAEHGLAEHTVHDQRAIAASTLAAENVDPYTIMEILGQASIQTTTIYVKTKAARLREAAETLDKHGSPQQGVCCVNDNSGSKNGGGGGN